MANTAREEGGWQAHEKSMLLYEIERAEAEGRPVKSVFQKVAEKTGRKPNSIRNYYYMKLKENEFVVNRIHTFVPFSKEEILNLIEVMLTEQVKGRSVRSIAMSMAEGDEKLMIRYQNKFRSTVRNNPDVVKEVMLELKKKDIEFCDPYKKGEKRIKKKTDMADALSGMVQNLYSAGQDAEVIINSLSNLARMAAFSKNNTDEEQLAEDVQTVKLEAARTYAEKEQLEMQNEALKEQCRTLREEIKKQTQMNFDISARLNELVAINKNFVHLKGMNKISGLTEYINSLQSFISRI